MEPLFFESSDGTIILLRVAPSSAVTQGGKLVMPAEDLQQFLRVVSLSSTTRKLGAELEQEMNKSIRDQGEKITQLLSRCPGATGIIVASSYGLPLLLSNFGNETNENNNQDVVKLSHGCLLIRVETRNDPQTFNVDNFLQRLQHITGDTTLSLREPPKYLCSQSEGCFVPIPLQDTTAIQTLEALERMDLPFFNNEANFTHIINVTKKQSMGWVIWPRLLVYMLVDQQNRRKWNVLLDKIAPVLPSEEKKLLLLLLENFKIDFPEIVIPEKIDIPATTTPCAPLCVEPGPLAGRLSAAEMLIIQPLISLIISGLPITPVNFLSMSETLFKRAMVAAQKVRIQPAIPLPKSLPKTCDKDHQHLVDFVLMSRNGKSGEWTKTMCGTNAVVKFKPQTQITFQVGNHVSQPIYWQIWNFSGEECGAPTLLVPYCDPSGVATATSSGEWWPASADNKSAQKTKNGQIVFELETGRETVVFFAWWNDENNVVRCRRIVQGISIGDS